MATEGQKLQMTGTWTTIGWFAAFIWARHADRETAKKDAGRKKRPS